MPALYDIVTDILRVVDDVDEHGEMPADVESRLDQLTLDRATVLDHLCRYFRQSASEAERFKAERERLAALEKSWGNRAERIKRYLQLCLERAGETKVNTELFSVAIQKNSVPTTSIQEGTPIPAAYQRVRVELDTARVVEAFKAGQTLPVGVQCAYGSHIRIR